MHAGSRLQDLIDAGDVDREYRLRRRQATPALRSEALQLRDPRPRERRREPRRRPHAALLQRDTSVPGKIFDSMRKFMRKSIES